MKIEVFLPPEVLPEETDIVIQLSQWFFKVGDYIEKGADLAEVTTDKAAFVVPAPATGVIEQILVEEDSKIDPKKPICIINAIEDSIPHI